MLIKKVNCCNNFKLIWVNYYKFCGIHNLLNLYYWVPWQTVAVWNGAAFEWKRVMPRENHEWGMLKRFIIRLRSRVFRTVERCLKGLDNDGRNCWWHMCGLLLICWYIVSGHCRRFQQFRPIQCRLDILQWSVISKHYIFEGLPVFKKIIYT